MTVKKKQIYFIFLLVMGVTFLLLGLYKKVNEDKVKLLKSESFFDKFDVKGDKVYIKCFLTIQNSSSYDKYINLSANLKRDAANGLLKSPIVSGVNKRGSDKFLIKANSTKGYNITFIGEFGGTLQKLTRNLPPIEIKEVDN